MKNKDFIHLRLHSSYSLSEGAVKIPQLIELSKKFHMPAVAVTDSNNLFASLEFSMAAASEGIQPIIGIELSCDFLVKTKLNSEFHKIILLAKNANGFANLIKLSSKAYIDSKGEQAPHVKFSDLKEWSQGLIALTAGIDGVFDDLILSNSHQEAEKILLELKEIYGNNLFMEFNRHGNAFEEDLEKIKIPLALKHNIPIIATNNVFFADREKFEAHDALLCISEGRYLVEEDRRRSNEECFFKSSRQMSQLFSDLPEAIDNTILVAKSCGFKVSEHPPMLPNFTKDGLSESESLRNESIDGLEERFIQMSIPQEEHEKYRKRLEYELNIIIEMGFPGYFLIVSDFIKWSKKNDIPVGPGRGSGAGSLVAWSLQITDLDPIKFGLIFERFLNPERVSMPDFDIDFCQEKRDLVIEYVQQKYGYDRVAQIITFGKLQARAVLRDVGRVMQMSYSEVDRISKMVPFNPVNPVDLSGAIEMEPMLRKAAQDDRNIAKLLDTALKLEGLNRHVSTHAAGVVIADRPLLEIVPLYKDHKSDMLVVQYSMKYAEAVGLVKFDFLGLKTLTLIADCCKIIKETQKIDIEITKIDLKDAKTFEMLSKGISIGVFQFESAGMRDALCKMRPDSIEDLIALGALYRPGPMDNIPTYIACKHGIEKPDYLHPSLEEVLKETFGVIIYQEQVMKIAQILAGYTLGAADLLRRAMGKKIKAEMDDQREIFVSGAVKNKLPMKRASEIFDLVAKFAGYGFNKSHAAAYAMISYQTAFLKANHPLEFIVTTLNLEINDTDKIVIFIQEAKHLGLEILPPCINFSQEFFSIENGKIRYALAALKGVGLAAMKNLRMEREKNGKFKSLDNFISRLDGSVINKRQLESLIKSGAFESIYENRRELCEAVEIITKQNGIKLQELETGQISLFGTSSETNVENAITKMPEWNEDEKLAHEALAVGFYLRKHPVDKFVPLFRIFDIKLASEIISQMENGVHLLKICGVVLSSRTRVSPKGRYVTVQMSDPSGIIEFSVFDDAILASASKIFSEKGAIHLEAEVRKDDGGIRVNARDIHVLHEFFSSKTIFVNLTTSSKEIALLIKENIVKNTEDCFINVKFNVKFLLDSHELDLELPEIYKVNPNLILKMETHEAIQNFKIITSPR